MTEQEYINLQALSNLEAANNVLRDIMPSNVPAIDNIIFRDIRAQLCEWSDELRLSIKISDS